MNTTIGHISYPNRKAFFEKLALSLPPQPTIKIGPAPLPSGEHRRGLWNMRKAVPTETLSTAQRSMKTGRSSLRDHREVILGMETQPPNINVLQATWRRVKKGHIKVRDLTPVKGAKGGGGVTGESKPTKAVRAPLAATSKATRSFPAAHMMP